MAVLKGRDGLTRPAKLAGQGWTLFSLFNAGMELIEIYLTQPSLLDLDKPCGLKLFDISPDTSLP